LKQPTLFSPSQKESLKSSRNVQPQKKYSTAIKKTNIVTFTPSKLDKPFMMDAYREGVSCKGSSTCAFSDTKSYNSLSQF